MGHTHRYQIGLKKKNQVKSPSPESRVPEIGSDPPIGSDRESGHDMRYHFVREIIEECGVLVQKIKTDDIPTNMLTKAVTTIKFNHCLDLINIAKV